MHWADEANPNSRTNGRMVERMRAAREAFLKTSGVIAAVAVLGAVVAVLVLVVLPALGLPVTNADQQEQQAERDGRIVARCTDA